MPQTCNIRSMNTPIRLSSADYAWLMPLVSKEVRPEGIDLELVLGRRGSWPERAEMLRRALHDTSLHGGEASMGVHLRRIDKGDRSFVALPVFGLRNFTARDLYVRHDSSLASADQLAGKRIGMYSWSASGSIWYRHFLAHHGVDWRAVSWTIGEVDGAFAVRLEPDFPSNVVAAPGGRSLSDMLLAGEIDAIHSPPRPLRYDPARGPIRRLYPDARGVEAEYFAATKVFPPQHLIVIRRDIWEADKSLAPRLTAAFVACEDAFRASVRSFPYVSPWLNEEVEASDAALGDNPYAHGLETNRATMGIFAEQAFHFGLTQRRVEVDDYFAEFLAS